MYVPDHFSPPDDAALVSLIRAHPFGTIVTADLQASHIPFLLEEGKGGLVLHGHVAKANAHWQAFDGSALALVMFQGPDGYISPGWGDCSTLVPTWNYMIVHAKGAPKLVEGRAEKVRLLHLMTEAQEAHRDAPWVMGDLQAGKLDQLLDALVVFEIPITHLEGKWKLSQNRDAATRAAFTQAVEAEGNEALAGAMKQA